MSKEREFLKKLRYASLLENDLRKELEELLAQPETEQEPLSDEEIADLWWNNYVGTADSVRNFARAIEKTHGIGVDDETV